MLWKIDRSDQAPLHQQVASCVRRGIADGVLGPDERLPPARDLATVVDVHPNTVLQAYRTLRSEGLVEFRRGRGVRITGGAGTVAPVTEAARTLVRVARHHGYTRAQLLTLLAGLPPEEPW